MEVQKNRSKYCKRPCVLALALHLKRCSVYPLAWHHLWHLKSNFPSDFVWSVSEMCMSRSYDFSLPLINFCIGCTDCIPDTIYLLRNVDPLSQGVPVRSLEGWIQTWPHYWQKNTAPTLSSYRNDDTVWLVRKETGVPDTLVVSECSWTVCNLVILRFLLSKLLNLYINVENSILNPHVSIIQLH